MRWAIVPAVPEEAKALLVPARPAMLVGLRMAGRSIAPKLEA